VLSDGAVEAQGGIGSGAPERTRGPIAHPTIGDRSYELRLLLASRSEVLSAVIRIVMRVLLGWYRRRGRALGLQEAETGAVSFVQRFGGSMNCHTHLHVIVIDGVHSRQDGGTTRFHFVEPPSAQEQRKVTIHQQSWWLCRQ